MTDPDSPTDSQLDNEPTEGGTPTVTPGEDFGTSVVEGGDDPRDPNPGDLSTDTALNAYPSSPTFTDGDGVDRIATPDPQTGWVPAPTESDPEDRETIEERQRELERRDAARRGEQQ